MEETSGGLDEPESKRPKLDAELCDAESLIRKILSSEKNLTPVVDLSLTETVPTIKIYGGLIKDKKFLSIVVAELSRHLPIPTLQHLKRIRNATVILCLASDVDDNIEEYIKMKCSKYVEYFDDYCLVDVPAQAPKVKKQFIECNKIWPCNFHPDKYIELLLSGTFFSKAEMMRHRTLMALCFEIGIMSNNDMLGAVVYDPHINSIVAVGYDNRTVHPAQHTAMVAIDNVAKSQNGGSWVYPKHFSRKSEHAGVPHPILDRLQTKYPDVKFGCQPVIKDQSGAHDSGPYLCTGYFIYTVQEPCLMCAMGLIHARVSRVFYSLPSPDGGLRTKCSLHLVKSLNHHYEVFTGFL